MIENRSEPCDTKVHYSITMMIIAISSEHLHNRSSYQVGSAAARPPGSPQTPPHNASDLLSFSNSFVLFTSSVCFHLYFRSSPQPPAQCLGPLVIFHFFSICHFKCICVIVFVAVLDPPSKFHRPPFICY